MDGEEWEERFELGDEWNVTRWFFIIDHELNVKVIMDFYL